MTQDEYDENKNSWRDIGELKNNEDDLYVGYLDWEDELTSF